MRELILCARCAEKLERGGVRVSWCGAPDPLKKQQCQECRKKSYCGVAVIDAKKQEARR